MKYAKLENGQVRVYNTLPKTYENIINFQKAEIETINSKGFYELVEPTITQYQRVETLLPIDFVDNQFIQRVYNFTQAEIDADKQSKLEALKQEYSQRISDILGMREAIERLAIEQVEIPQEILMERSRLMEEYENAKLAL